MIGLGWRRFRRGLRAGDYRTLLAALVLTVAALSAVGTFSERMGRLMNTEANNLLAADAALSADHALPAHYRQQAEAMGLQQVELALFPSMVSANGRTQVTSIKAVRGPHPLRGELLLERGSQVTPVQGPPPAGSVWVDARLATLLAVAPGDSLRVGRSQLRIDALLSREPDAAVDFSSLQPRLLMNQHDLPATGLIGFGSRVKYRLLSAGPAEAVQAWKHRLAPQLQRGEKLEDVREARPEVKNALERAETFLRLVTLLAATLSAAAILLAARRHAARQADAIALYVTLGASRRRVQALLLAELGLLLLIGVLAGGALGWLAQQGLAWAVQPQLPAPLPPGSAYPWLAASGLGCLLMAGVALPVLLQLARTPPLRVLRRELQASAPLWLSWLLTGGAFAALFLAVAGSPALAGSVAAGMAATLALAGLLGGLGLWWLRALSRGFAARIALRQLLRRRWLALAQLSALATGLMGLWLLTSVQAQLLGIWQQQIPVDAPNQFAINIQPEQAEPFRQALAALGIQATLYPMIKARWVAHNGAPVDLNRFQEERARRLAEREFNLSTGQGERADNRLIAGQPLGAQPGLSVESGLAQSLGIKLGDSLSFDIAGSRVSAPVINLRKVDWESFRVNFFVTGSEALFAQMPASMITSFRLAPEQRSALPGLVAQFPNVTLVDVEASLAQVRQVIALVSSALQLVFGFCLAAGLVVMLAALETTAPERRRETTLLRALGADSRRIAAIHWWEGASIGGIAGLVAGLGASLAGWLVGRQALQLELAPDLGLPLYSLITGIALALATTLWERRRLRQVSAMALLRDPG